MIILLVGKNPGPVGLDRTGFLTRLPGSPPKASLAKDGARTCLPTGLPAPLGRPADRWQLSNQTRNLLDKVESGSLSRVI